MTKSITFVLPGTGKVPVGGFKVVYEYANCLVARGHRVTVVHPERVCCDETLLRRMKHNLRYLKHLVGQSYLPDSWFQLDDRVKTLWTPTLAARRIPDADVVVATAWQTAEWVASYGDRKGAKYYLIQHLENWAGPEDRVLRTWSSPLYKIVIAKWLGEIAAGLGESYAYIPNGLNFSQFGLDFPIESRNPLHLMMLYHDQPWKGSKDGLQALDLVRKRFPEIKVTLFGVSDAKGLPEWVVYHRAPEQRRLRALYNEAAVFLAPSWAEGWPLPPAEAMICGAAVVATDIGGHREYAEDGVTASLAPPKDPAALAEKICALLENPDRRIGLARAARENIQQFTWGRACDRLEKIFITN